MSAHTAKRRSRTSSGPRRGRAAYMEFLEARLLMIFIPGDANAVWTDASMDATGTIQLNAFGGITAGFLVHADASETIPSGGYSLAPISGVLSTFTSSATMSGAM